MKFIINHNLNEMCNRRIQQSAKLSSLVLMRFAVQFVHNKRIILTGQKALLFSLFAKVKGKKIDFYQTFSSLNRYNSKKSQTGQRQAFEKRNIKPKVDTQSGDNTKQKEGGGSLFKEKAKRIEDSLPPVSYPRKSILSSFDERGIVSKDKVKSQGTPSQKGFLPFLLGLNRAIVRKDFQSKLGRQRKIEDEVTGQFFEKKVIAAVNFARFELKKFRLTFFGQKLVNVLMKQGKQQMATRQVLKAFYLIRKSFLMKKWIKLLAAESKKKASLNKLFAPRRQNARLRGGSSYLLESRILRATFGAKEGRFSLRPVPASKLARFPAETNPSLCQSKIDNEVVQQSAPKAAQSNSFTQKNGKTIDALSSSRQAVAPKVVLAPKEHMEDSQQQGEENSFMDPLHNIVQSSSVQGFCQSKIDRFEGVASKDAAPKVQELKYRKVLQVNRRLTAKDGGVASLPKRCTGFVSSGNKSYIVAKSNNLSFKKKKLKNSLIKQFKIQRALKQ